VGWHGKITTYWYAMYYEIMQMRANGSLKREWLFSQDSVCQHVAILLRLDQTECAPAKLSEKPNEFSRFKMS
jgi:hypothetical protein